MFLVDLKSYLMIARNIYLFTEFASFVSGEKVFASFLNGFISI